VIQQQLPRKFRPKLHAGSGIAGICLIRLEQIRPAHIPAIFGISSENAAHRIAVLWDDEHGHEQEGVFIPRRDTNSWLKHLSGGRLFPGEHNRAYLKVQSLSDHITFQMKSRDGEVSLELRARTTPRLPACSQFSSLAEASGFFEPGSLGYSVTGNETRLDGVRLQTKTWTVQPLDVESVHSSFFADENRFPRGSVNFDCALLMRNIEHEWLSAPDLYL